MHVFQTGRFIWLDGSRWTYADWLAGEPNNTSNLEDCVEVLAFGRTESTLLNSNCVEHCVSGFLICSLFIFQEMGSLMTSPAGNRSLSSAPIQANFQNVSFV